MSNITEMLAASLIQTIPTLFVVVIAIYIARNFLERYLKQKENYREDKYRLDIERKISELNNAMLKGEARFNKVNHLLLEGNKVHTSDFLESMGVDKEIKVKEKSAFVLIPFHPEFDESYDWIKTFFYKHGYTCTRGDAVLAESNILSHILSEMLSSEIVIANITGRNSNVYYELGIAHALGKQVILIAESAEDITFDISNAQVVIYKNESSLNESLGKWLVSILRTNKEKAKN